MLTTGTDVPKERIQQYYIITSYITCHSKLRTHWLSLDTYHNLVVLKSFTIDSYQYLLPTALS